MVRPKKNIKRTENFKVHLTSLEKRIISSKAKVCGVPVSIFLRLAALDLKIVPRLTDDEIRIFQAAVSISNNLNQLTKKIHIGVSELELAEIRDEIRILINRLRK